MAEIDLKQEIAAQAKKTEQEQSEIQDNVKLTSNMSIPDIVKALGPELKKALPSVLTPERFIRIALSALNNTPQLKQCTPMSFTPTRSPDASHLPPRRPPRGLLICARLHFS